MQRFDRLTKPKQHAFTLLELMITLVVLGVVLGAALPSFKSQLARNSADVLGQDIIFALQLARSEAIKRSGNVSLCASNDGATCSNDANGWTKGFIAVVDYAATEAANPVLTNAANPTKTILRVWERQNAKAVLTVDDSDNISANTIIARGSRSFIRFTSMGTLSRLINSPGGIVIKMKMKEKESADASSCELRSARQYTLGLVGTVRLASQACW